MTDRQLGTSIIYLYKMIFFNFAQCVYALADIDMYIRVYPTVLKCGKVFHV